MSFHQLVTLWFIFSVILIVGICVAALLYAFTLARHRRKVRRMRGRSR